MGLAPTERATLAAKFWTTYTFSSELNPILLTTQSKTHEIGHVMGQRRRISNPPQDIRNHGRRHLGHEMPRRGRRILGGHDGAHDGDAVEGLGGGATCRDDGLDVGGVDTADADGRHGGVAGVGEGGEDLADALGADDGFGVLLGLG